VLNGRYGPYITDKERNAKIPKDKEPKSLTLEECQAWLVAAPVRTFGKWGRGAKKGAAAKAKTSKAKGKAADAAEPGADAGAARAAKGAARGIQKLAAKVSKAAANKKAPVPAGDQPAAGKAAAKPASKPKTAAKKKAAKKS